MGKNFGKIARRYAKALILSSRLEGYKDDRLREQAISLKNLANVWQSNKDFSEAILNPMFKSDDREKALMRIAASCGCEDIVQKFLRVVFKRDRIAALVEISEAFFGLVEIACGIVDVEVILSKSVSEQEEREIEQSLSSKIPGILKFRWVIDKSILGGMVVKYQGQILDGSLSGRLERLEEGLLKAG